MLREIFYHSAAISVDVRSHIIWLRVGLEHCANNVFIIKCERDTSLFRSFAFRGWDIIHSSASTAVIHLTLTTLKTE